MFPVMTLFNIILRFLNRSTRLFPGQTTFYDGRNKAGLEVHSKNDAAVIMAEINGFAS
jgi:hypothetical protein